MEMIGMDSKSPTPINMEVNNLPCTSGCLDMPSNAVVITLASPVVAVILAPKQIAPTTIAINCAKSKVKHLRN